MCTEIQGRVSGVGEKIFYKGGEFFRPCDPLCYRVLPLKKTKSIRRGPNERPCRASAVGEKFSIKGESFFVPVFLSSVTPEKIEVTALVTESRKKS